MERRREVQREIAYLESEIKRAEEAIGHNRRHHSPARSRAPECQGQRRFEYQVPAAPGQEDGRRARGPAGDHLGAVEGGWEEKEALARFIVLAEQFAQRFFRIAQKGAHDPVVLGFFRGRRPDLAAIKRQEGCARQAH